MTATTITTKAMRQQRRIQRARFAIGGGPLCIMMMILLPSTSMIVLLWNISSATAGTPSTHSVHESFSIATRRRRRQSAHLNKAPPASSARPSSCLVLVESLRGGAGGTTTSSSSGSAKTKPKRKAAGAKGGGAASRTTKKKKSKTEQIESEPEDDSAAAAAGTATRRARRTKSLQQKKHQPPDKASRKKKEVVSQALHETDAAQALGDAIRQRAEQLRNDGADDYYFNTMYESSPSGRSIQSVGWALGASDYRGRRSTATVPKNDGNRDDGDAGVGLAPASVVASYFLKSHGGAHALQCACSALASLAGLGACWWNGSAVLQRTLLRRCLWLAMIKHVSGLLAAVALAARGISERQGRSGSGGGGARRSMQWMQQLAADPIAQYTFYAATLLVWLPSNASNKNAAATAAAVWWQAYPLVPFLLVGPVLLRELVSTALVVSDVLVLWAFSNTDAASTTIIQRLLTAARAVVDAFMSLLVTPTVWRTAQSTERQAILAKLTSKVSLAMEVAVGALLTVDAGLGLAVLIFGTAAAAAVPSTATSGTTTFGQLLKRLICTRLYLQFLWTRRRRIHRLATAVRGGASQLPLYVLSVALDPRAALGLASPPPPPTKEQQAATTQTKQEYLQGEERTWMDYVRLALEDDDKVASPI